MASEEMLRGFHDRVPDDRKSLEPGDEIRIVSPDLQPPGRGKQLVGNIESRGYWCGFRNNAAVVWFEKQPDGTLQRMHERRMSERRFYKAT